LPGASEQILICRVFAFVGAPVSGAFVVVIVCSKQLISFKIKPSNAESSPQTLMIKTIVSFGSVWPIAGKGCCAPKSMTASASKPCKKSASNVRYSPNAGAPLSAWFPSSGSGRTAASLPISRGFGRVLRHAGLRQQITLKPMGMTSAVSRRVF